MLDKVSIPKIYDSDGLLSLGQRRQKQLLNLIFIHLSKDRSRDVTNVNTRIQARYVFKIKTKMGRKCQKSSFF